MRSRSSPATPGPSSSICILDARVLARDRDSHARRSVAAGVLEHRLENPLGQVGVDADPERPRVRELAGATGWR